ncbi:glycosylase [Firmicutes bacterium AF36-3BH]|nr:glycosylase [Firmicutes bacterium AF36-3BH]
MITPKWLENAVFYNVYPQSFYDSNGDGIGDLNGITEKLNYIKDMGFTAIWLNPFYESSYRDGGYDVTDFYKVGKRYGTNADFKRLCTIAHQKGIKVCVDLVAGHTSLECEWFKKSCCTEKNEYTNRYVWTDNWLNIYNGECIGGYAQRNGAYMKNFFYCQPALNYGFANIDEPSWQLPPEHPDCRETKRELINIMEYWITLGADGFRVDLAASLIKNDYDGRAIIKFWREIRTIFDEKYPECVLISEWSHPSRAIAAGFHIDFLIHAVFPAYTSLFRAEDERNVPRIFFGNSFFDTRGNGNIETFLNDYLDEYEKTKDRGFISIPTGNHDLARISYGRTNTELEVIFAFIMTMPGIPFVYYGDEIGMEYIPDMPSKEGGFTRTGSRTPMQWKKGKNAGFSDGAKELLYLPVNENGVNVEEQLGDENSLLNKVKELIALRKTTQALSASGGIEFLNRKNGGYPLVYKRMSENEQYLICINPSNEDKRFEMELCVDVIMQNGNIKISEGEIVLGAVSYTILKLK